MWNFQEDDQPVNPDGLASNRLLAGALAELLRFLFREQPGPTLIAVGGPGGTGKSSFSRQLAAALPESVVLPLDDYKTPRTARAARGIFGAHPAANEMALLRRHLHRLAQGQPIDKPVYCAEAGAACRTVSFHPARYTILEGEIATYPQLRDGVDFSLFIDADFKTQFYTRIARDIEQRGYTTAKAMDTFWGSNLREFSRHGAPSKAWADVVLFCRSDYSLTIERLSEKTVERLPAGWRPGQAVLGEAVAVA